jgi:hypothetical protein
VVALLKNFHKGTLNMKRFARHSSFRLAVIGACALAVAILSGCAATEVAISKRNLDVQTKMSATIFLDPVAPEEQTVFVQVRNTSDKSDLDLSQDIKDAVAAKGWRIVTDPKTAKFYLQANVLQVGKTSPTAIQAALGQGYGTAGVGGAVAGLGVAGALGAGGRGMLAGMVVGGVADVVSGSLVKDVYYSIVTDVQIKERLAAGKTATLNSQHTNKQGTSGYENVTYNDQVDMKTYQTRIVSVANKMNLEFPEAAPALRTGLTRALSGLF